MPKENSKLIPEVNIGIVGHVDHGKTTLASALTGKFTDEHSEELKRGITIRLGYADVTLRKCPKCEANLSYSTFDKCFYCGSDTKILRTVSFVDVPGHETLIATVLTGSALMDGALLLVAANEKCPQPQTAEHLEALNIAGIKNIIIIQNKIDLVSKEEALANFKEIKKFVKGSVAEGAPIIPVSAIHRSNIGMIFKTIEDAIKTPSRDDKKSPKMLVARSFDVNRPGTEIKSLTGGIIGGGLVEGTLSVGDEIEICPGINENNKWTPVTARVESVNQGSHKVKTGRPGGLLAIGTSLDPSMTKSDNLASMVVGKPGTLPSLRDEISLDINLLEKAVGSGNGPDSGLNIRQNDVLLMNAGTQKTIGVCVAPGKTSKFTLKRPLCVEVGDKVVLSKQINARWRLIGWGVFKG
ncbi:MAG: translation initiation factor IF-2 subunit gamma [Candidatus Aenigmarchaeota archaeon]|nr:translation initiation factor IF-2 subunit gamma [Candidatus Aenigmarchaeota archaeon]